MRQGINEYLIREIIKHVSPLIRDIRDPSFWLLKKSSKKKPSIKKIHLK